MRFDPPVTENGYRWWYVDAVSDDGNHALTVIAFVGSVFSPYYRLAVRRGQGDPEHYCALNVALYGPQSNRWAMTERGSAAVERTQNQFRIGPSRLEWNGSLLTIDIDEFCAPIPFRVRGRIEFEPGILQNVEFDLDPAGAHRWQPIAPLGRATVRLNSPGLEWAGSGYVDTNGGDAPLEQGFIDWNWSRASSGKEASIRYNVRHHNGERESLSLHIGQDGALRNAPVSPVVRLPPTGFWKMHRESTADYPVQVIRTLEDTPFYARSIVAEARPDGDLFSMHESLSMRRFAYPVVQAMLPFRMPRRRRYQSRR